MSEEAVPAEVPPSPGAEPGAGADPSSAAGPDSAPGPSPPGLDPSTVPPEGVRGPGPLGRVLSNPFLRSVGILAGGTAGGQLILVLTTPILTRLFNPESVGALGLVTSAVSILSVVACLRYELVIVGAPNEREASYLTLGSLFLCLSTSLLATLGLTAVAQLHWQALRDMSFRVALLTGVSLAATVIFSVVRYSLVREQEFTVITRALLMQSLGRAAFPIGLGMLFHQWWALIVGDALGRFLGMSRALVLCVRRARQRIGTWSWSELPAVLRKHRRYPLISLPSALLDTGAAALPVPLVALLFGGAQAGLFVLAQRVTTLPVGIVTASIGDVFHARLARTAASSPEAMTPLFLRITMLLLLGGVPPALLAMLLAPSLTVTVFGPAWGETGLAIVALLPWTLALLIVSPLSRSLLVHHRLGGKLIYDVLALASTLLSFAAAWRWKLSFLSTVGLLSASQTACFVVYWVLLYVLIVRHAREPVRSNSAGDPGFGPGSEKAES